MCHPAQLPIEQLLDQCKIKRTRASGPGGQHRNKVETAIVVEHLPTGLRGEAGERRSQKQNREQAIFRLRVKLALEIRFESPVTPSLLWRRRVANRRISISVTHQDFPALLAEVLDSLEAHHYSTSRTAEKLGVSTSQLVKVVKVQRAALVAVNSERQRLGKQVLR